MTVVVRVPATSANLGTGFDALGLALGLYNTVALTPLPDGATDPARAATRRRRTPAARRSWPTPPCADCPAGPSARH